MRSPDPRPGRPGRRAHRTARMLVVAAVVSVLVSAGALMITRQNVDSASPADGSATKPVELANPAPSMAELEGIWSLDDGGALLRFGDDGTYALDDGGRLLAGPDESGTYSVYGSTLTMVAEDSRHCDVGQPWEWQVELLGDGRMHGIVTTAECLGRSVDWTWTRVSPDSRIDTTPSPRPPAADVPADLTAISGIWLLDGGSTLVAVSAEGAYLWDDRGHLDTAPADAGTVELDGATLTFTSGAQSATCDDGDLLVLDDVGFTAGRATQQRLYASVDTSSCTDISGAVSFTRVS